MTLVNFTSGTNMRKWGFLRAERAWTCRELGGLEQITTSQILTSVFLSLTSTRDGTCKVPALG